MLDFYQNYLGVDYPLPKQDMIAVPGLDSAMENWGLIIYGEHYLTHEDGVTSASEKELNAMVIAHEMAHQWFGNLVTISWWTEIWLNEGLATYLSYFGVDEVKLTLLLPKTVFFKGKNNLFDSRFSPSTK